MSDLSVQSGHLIRPRTIWRCMSVRPTKELHYQAERPVQVFTKLYLGDTGEKMARRHGGAMPVRHLLNSYQKNITTRLAISLQKDAPIPRAVQTVRRTLAMPVLGGLHHQSSRHHVPSTGGG